MVNRVRVRGVGGALCRPPREVNGLSLYRWVSWYKHLVLSSNHSPLASGQNGSEIDAFMSVFVSGQGGEIGLLG